MGIANILNNTLTNVQEVNQFLKLYHTIDKNTPLRDFATAAGASSNDTQALESMKGSRVFSIDLASPPVDAGGSGLNNILWSTEVQIRVRYDWQGALRTYPLAAEDASWIIASMMNPDNFVTEQESVAPPTTTYEKPSSDTLIMVITFPMIYYESSLSALN
jgi:hypothetical protein